MVEDWKASSGWGGSALRATASAAPPGPGSTGPSGIRDVWAFNLEEELDRMMDLVENYPYVAVDTEFPGVVARPVGSFKSTTDYHYQTLKCNVDLLKVIQIGFSFMNKDGKRPPGIHTWQFNFKFSLADDVYSHDSIELLKKSGLDFKSLEENGIDVREFAEQLTVSGVVLNDDIRWLAFHSGFDFAYLLRLLSGQDLPEEESEFFTLLSFFFPHIYDLKYLMRSCEGLTGGLQKLASDLDVSRIGSSHTAGSDALLTGSSFFILRKKFFEDRIDDEKYDRLLYGLGDYSASKVSVRH